MDDVICKGCKASDDVKNGSVYALQRYRCNGEAIFTGKDLTVPIERDRATFDLIWRGFGDARKLLRNRSR